MNKLPSFLSKRSSRVLLILIGLFCAAPTPGDVGGCGQRAQELDPVIFFESKANIDCERCIECGLNTTACKTACDVQATLQREFPKQCLPLVHDGEVCLRALLYADCDNFETYVRDTEPRVPTECDFCPRRQE